MKKEVDEGRRLASAIASRHTRNTPLPEPLRREATAYVGRRIAEGATQTEIARELGVTMKTVRRWLPAPATKLRRVSVVDADARVPASETKRTIVIAPGGLRIEGLSISEVAALIRALE